MKAVLAAGLLLALPGSARAIEQQVQGVVSLRLFDADTTRSWVDGGLGKLRFDDDDAPIDLGAGIVAYGARLLPTLAARAVASAYADGPGSLLDLDEAYLEWRPVPR